MLYHKKTICISNEIKNITAIKIRISFENAAVKKALKPLMITRFLDFYLFIGFVTSSINLTASFIKLSSVEKNSGLKGLNEKGNRNDSKNIQNELMDRK